MKGTSGATSNHMLLKIILLYSQKDADNYSHEKQASKKKKEAEVQKFIKDVCGGGFKVLWYFL